MKKVFQDVVDPGKGNCLQAAFASLFELELYDVPHFLLQRDWFATMIDVITKNHYAFGHFEYNVRDLGRSGKDKMQKVIKQLNGVNGYFIAAVYSPKYFNPENYCDASMPRAITHAVIVDKQLNIVHDPNPNNNDYVTGEKSYPLSRQLLHNGITYVYLIDHKETLDKMYASLAKK